jgi:hypothetical protein
MPDQCNRCRYWLVDEKTIDPADKNFAFGRCRLAPPVVLQTIAARLMRAPEYGQPIDPELGTIDVARSSVQPVSFATDWCGSFAPHHEMPIV